MKFIVKNRLGFLVQKLKPYEIDQFLQDGNFTIGVREELINKYHEGKDLYVMLATDYYRAPWRFAWSDKGSEEIYPFTNCQPSYTDIYKI